MKINKSLLIVSMVLISLLAVSAVSAADDAADIVAASDIDEVQAIDNAVEDVAASDNAAEDIAASDNQADDLIASTNDDQEVLSIGNGTGNGTGGFDMSSLGGNGTGMGMGGNGSFDFSSMMNMFGGGGSSASDSIECKDLSTYYAKTTTYKVTVLDSKKNPIAKAYVTVKVNGKAYTAKTNSKGVATLKLKLKPGKYSVIAYYGQVKNDADIVIKDVLKTKNALASTKKGGKFTVKVLNKKGKAYAKQTVAIQFNKKIYKIKTNKKGIATFKIPKKLKKGKYTIKTNYNGLTKTNKILVQ